MAFNVSSYVFYSVFPVESEIEPGRIVSLEVHPVTGAVYVRPPRRDDDSGIIAGVYGGGGLVYSVGGEFALTDQIMGRTNPGGPDMTTINLAVGQALTVSSQGDGMIIASGVAGDPIIGRVTDWDGSTLRFRLNVEGVLPDTIPVQSWETMDEAAVRLKQEKLEQRRLAMAAKQLALASAGVDKQDSTRVTLKLDDGPVEWDY